jgi:hypothetical protein
MFDRLRLGVLLLACVAVSISGCSNASSGLDSIQVTPSTNAMVQGGPTLQLTATGTFGNAKHLTTASVTSGVVWSSSSSGIAQVDPSTGVVSAGGAGTATITATAQGFAGPVSSSATVTVTAPASGPGGSGPVSSEGLISLTIVPSAITVGDLQDTGNFVAIGTYAVAPVVRDVTNSVVWSSSFPQYFPVTSNTGGNAGATAGIVTAYGSGVNAQITAEVTDPVTQSIQYATATFSCPYVAPCPCTLAYGGCAVDVPSCPNGPVAGSCFPGSEPINPLLSSVTVYNEGLNNTTWLVTAPSATGTPNVINCGPGAGKGNSVCTAYYPVNVPFTLTAPAGTGNFGGWSHNCTPNPNPPTAAGPNTCTLTPTTSSETVGAIFN